MPLQNQPESTSHTQPSGYGFPIFYGCVLILTILSIYPIWAFRFLPMQDYPQHLFLAQIIATYDNPAYNWKEFYTVNLSLKPYMLWYLAMKPLSLIWGVETAGKLLFSLYILLISTLTILTKRLSPPSTQPWGALLMFPFTFNQIYYMGFANYLLSIPIIMITVLDLEELSRKQLSRNRYLFHIFLLFLLYLNHPYSVLVYVGLALTTALTCFGKWKSILRLITPTLMISSVFLIWYFTSHGPSSAPKPYEWHITWLPAQYSIVYYIIMFTGMRCSIGIDWLSTTAWLIIFFISLAAWQRYENRYKQLIIPIAMYCATVIGFLVLPCWYGYYSYFNLRLAPVSYFLLALLLCRLSIPIKSGIIIFLLCIMIVVGSIKTQGNIDTQTNQFSKLFKKAEKNSTILPISFNSESYVIEPIFFYQFHSHEISYYHLLKGGGANPALFKSSMLPVQYKQGVYLPYPDKPNEFNWIKHGRYYRYILLRHAPPEFTDQLRLNAELIEKSGPWELYRNKMYHSDSHQQTEQ